MKPQELLPSFGRFRLIHVTKMLRSRKALRYLVLMRALIIIGIALLAIGCEKEPGEGGQASIQGKIFVQEYNANCSELRAEYYVVDEEVYIIAGDDPSYFERVRTGPDGTYWFPYLRKGKYTVYAISDNCDNPGQDTTIQVTAEIEDRKQELVLPDIVIIK